MATIKKNYTPSSLPVAFSRGEPIPIDKSLVWYSFEELKTYAESGATAYVGQVLSFVDEESGTATVYVIADEAGTLEKVGTSPVGDESTITVAENGTVSLYGIDGIEVESKTYQPLLVNGILTWVEPSATTVEGLATEIEGLKSRVGAVETSVTAINNKIGEVAEDKTVVEMIADAKAEATYDDTTLVGRVDTLEGKAHEHSNKDVLDGITSDKVSAWDKAEQNAVDRVLGYLAEDEINTDFDTLKEVAEWIESDTTASAELVIRVSNIENDYLKGADKTALQGEIDALEAFIGELPEDAVSETVVGYIKEVVGALQIGDYAKASDLTALANRVTALENVGAEKNVIATVDEGQFAIDDSRNLTLLDIAMGKVTGLSDALAGKVATEEGKSLIQDTLIEKLEGIATGAQVNVINSVDTAQFAIDEDKKLTLLDVAMGKVTGLSEALATKVDKVEGSRLITSDEASKLESLVLSEDGSVEISGEVNASNVKELGSWITTNRGTVLGLLSAENETKLDGVEAGAQVNKIESVKVGGTLLDITEKSVNIPVATGTLLGVVMSSAAENKVAVAEDGTMEVNSVNINKLTQNEGDFLVLDGGASA